MLAAIQACGALAETPRQLFIRIGVAKPGECLDPGRQHPEGVIFRQVVLGEQALAQREDLATDAPGDHPVGQRIVAGR